VLYTVRGQIKHSDTIGSQVYLIYKNPATVLEVFSLEGRLIASFDIKDIIYSKLSSSIKLTRLDFVLIPVLKWTGRRNNLLKAFG